MSTANTPEEPPMTSSDSMEEYEETVEWIVGLGVDRAAAEMSLAWAKPRIPTPGDHDELLARTATHRSDGVGGGVALILIRELETALRAEQSARQAAEAMVAQFELDVAQRSEDGRTDWDYEQRIKRAKAERDSLQQCINAALELLPIYWEINNGWSLAEKVRHTLTAHTESKEPDHA